MTFCHMQQNSQNFKIDSKVEQNRSFKSFKNAPNVLANPWTPLDILSKYKTPFLTWHNPLKVLHTVGLAFLTLTLTNTVFGRIAQVWIWTWSLLSMSWWSMMNYVNFHQIQRVTVLKKRLKESPELVSQNI